jgi:organic radical activating enzyme
MLEDYFVRDVYSNLSFIDFSLTRKCNYNCTYCSAGLGADKNHYKNHASAETLGNFKNILKRLPSGCVVQIIGGEPTLHPGFFDLAKEVLDNDLTLEISTNFSWPNQKFNPIIDCVKKIPLRISAALHVAQVKSTADFLAKAAELKAYGRDKIQITIVSVVTEENYQKLRTLHTLLQGGDILFLPKRLKIPQQGFICYSRQVETWLSAVYQEKTGAEKLLNFQSRGVICQAGHRFIKIYEDGRVCRCFGTTHKGLFHLGNINTDWATHKEPLPCLATKCTCGLMSDLGLLSFDSRDSLRADKIIQELQASHV